MRIITHVIPLKSPDSQTLQAQIHQTLSLAKGEVWGRIECMQAGWSHDHNSHNCAHAYHISISLDNNLFVIELIWLAPKCPTFSDYACLDRRLASSPIIANPGSPYVTTFQRSICFLFQPFILQVLLRFHGSKQRQGDRATLLLHFVTRKHP